MDMIIPDHAEVWLAIPGYEELYEVSNCGEIRVKATRRNWTAGRILSGGKDRFGYKFIRLTDEDGISKSHMKHRLVLLAFAGECPQGYEVNHKNGIKGDNRLENLEYMTHKENIQHSFDILKRGSARGEDAGHSVLTEDDIPVILQMIQDGKSQREIGKLYGVSHVAIGAISRGLTWTHLERGDFQKPAYCGERRVNAKLTADNVAEIHRMIALGKKHREIAAHFNVSQPVISNIRRGKSYARTV